MLPARSPCLHGLQLEDYRRSGPVDMPVLPRFWEGVESGPQGGLLSVPSSLRGTVCPLPAGLR
jgi:hypothetical protein